MIAPVGNPFFHRGPIRDPTYFCGRERIVSRTLAFLAQGQSVSLVGPRRIGKTSLLLHLARPEVQRAHDLQLTCAYVDAESWGLAPPELIYGRLRGAALGAPAVAPEPASFRELEQTVHAALQDGRQLVVLCDEFDTLAGNPQLDKDFFSSLRALATEHRLAYVTVSSRPLLALPYAHAKTRSSPFFNFFAQIRVGLLSAEESAGLLGRLAALGGHTFAPTQIAQLLDLAGPHPLFLQIAGYHTIDQLSADGGAPQRLRAAFEEEAGEHWAHLWQALTPEDQRLLALLPALAARRPADVRRLAEAGLLTLDAAGRPQLFATAFADYVGAQPVAGLIQAPPVTIAPELRIALLRGRPLALAPQLFDLLSYMAQRRGQLVPRDELARTIWGNTEPQSLESLRTALRMLREALGADQGCVQSVRGAGCVFVGG